MNDLISNILRGSVSTVMYIMLLLTLTKSKLSRKTTILIATLAFVISMASTVWFYVNGDLTALSRFTLVLFIVVGLVLKPLTRLNTMQWCFTFLTTINIAMMVIILSFHLGKLFPEPQYANTILRLVLYLIVIFLFQRFLLPSYQSAVDNWPIFSSLMICIFLNLSYYFYATDDIQNTLTTHKWPLLLLVALSLTAYGTVFHSLKRFMAIHALEMENLKIQQETERLHEAAIQLEKYANYDTLTGLPNRRFFFERLDWMVTENEKQRGKFALLYIDLDGFKNINDTYGHEVGDRVLNIAGNRLSMGIRKTDFVARLGGDEFAVITHDMDDMAIVENLAKEIHAKLQEVIYLDAIQCKVSASIGIALYPDTGKDSETLVRNADAAMYGIKRNGNSGIGISGNQTK